MYAYPGRLAIAALLCLATASTARSQAGRPGAGRAGTTPASPLYDTATVETFTGRIARIDTVAEGRGPAAGLHLMVESGGRTLPVHVGPTWYAEQQRFRLTVGERVTVRGSRVTWQGAPALIAAEVRRGDAVLPLRDRVGAPRWRAQSTGRRPAGRRP